MSLALSLSRIVAVTLFIIAGTFFSLTHQAEAAFGIPAGGVELAGFAWSGYNTDSNPVPDAGVGWISMNCTNTDTCVGGSGVGPKVDYAVRLQNNGNLAGYAWSSNIGWINFNPGTALPTDADVANQTAGHVSGTYPNVTFGGWARACAVFANPSACSGPLSTEAGGWDGWIALGGTADDGARYEITMTAGGAANGPTNYAWGGPIVVGWIDFSAAGADPVTFDITPPVVTFNCPSNSIISTGDSVDCTYTVTPDPSGSVDNCTLSSDTGPDQAIPTTNGTLTLSPIVTTIYTLVCGSTGITSIPVTQEIEVRSNIVIDSPQIILGPQNPTTGAYNWVDVRYRIQSLPSGQTIIYVVELDGQADGTGTITGIAGGAPQTSTHRFTNVPYSATPAAYEIMVDETPLEGAVEENIPSTPVDEDVEGNSMSGTQSLPAPNPTIIIDLPDFVRAGNPAEVGVTIRAIYDTTCELFGPGFTAPTSIFTVAAGVEYNNTFSTAVLTNATNIVVRCEVPGGPDFSVNSAVEVIPAFQEV